MPVLLVIFPHLLLRLRLARAVRPQRPRAVIRRVGPRLLDGPLVPRVMRDDDPPLVSRGDDGGRGRRRQDESLDAGLGVGGFEGVEGAGDGGRDDLVGVCLEGHDGCDVGDCVDSCMIVQSTAL